MPLFSNATALPMIILETKLVPPQFPLALVVRKQLLHRLDAALSHRLTLLSAAAGWGKTTLLSAWLAESSQPVGWVSLDELDNAPIRFWTAIMTALRNCTPTVGEVALAMLHSAETPPFTTILTVLLNELAARPEPQPILLILDDYHLISDPAIHESLTFLIEHLPTHVHLVIATRVDPELPLSRWRVRDEMVELRAADLRFTTEEATGFFSHTLDEALADEDVRLLEQRTEGWPAGLQLAALAMRQRTDRAAFVQRFTGGHRYLLDYVQEEILQRQPLPVQRFLLHTAVLTRLTAPLCAAVTANSDSQAMLEGLERSNLFVVPLDEGRQWYRVHDLFREVLLARLQATEPTLVPLLHQRAARWYAARNELHEAIAHALSAADFAYAADLIARVAPAMWTRGEAQTVHKWLALLPDVLLLQHARFVLDAARHLLEALHATIKASYTSGQAQVEQTIARVEALLHDRLETSTYPDIEELADASFSVPEITLFQRRIRLLRALTAARPLLTGGDIEQMQLLAEETAALAAEEEIEWKLIGLSISYWHTESLQRQGGLLILTLRNAKEQALAEGNQPAAIRIMRMLALAYLRSGQFHRLHEEGMAGLALAEQHSVQTATIGYLHYFMSGAYYAWNQLNEAVDAMRLVLQIGRTWQQADLLIVGNAFLAQLLVVKGDISAAQEALQAAEALVAQERFLTHTPVVVAMRVYYWLATDDMAAAHQWAPQVDASVETWHPNRNVELLLLIRVYLAQQQYTTALTLLERFRAHFDRPGDTHTAVSYLSLQIVAYQGNRQHQQARTLLLRLLTLAAPEENIRIFLDAGEPMQAVLQRLLVKPDAVLSDVMVIFVKKLLAAFDGETVPGVHSVGNQPRKPIPSPTPRKPTTPLIEPLTRREEQVLRLLVVGTSNQEIADELVISLATVKKHVSNVLGKLGVSTRSQAIARVRDWPPLS